MLSATRFNAPLLSLAISSLFFVTAACDAVDDPAGAAATGGTGATAGVGAELVDRGFVLHRADGYVPTARA